VPPDPEEPVDCPRLEQAYEVKTIAVTKTATTRRLADRRAELVAGYVMGQLYFIWCGFRTFSFR